MNNTCAICEKVHNGRSKNFCPSKECTLEYYRRRSRRIYAEQGKIESMCNICSQVYTLPYSYKKKHKGLCKACSLISQQKAREKKSICQRCSKEYLASQAWQKYCSKECRFPSHDSICRVCGKSIISRNKKNYCNIKCYNKELTNSCIYCGKAIVRTRQYCSKTCIRLNSDWEKQKCPKCGTKYLRSPADIRNGKRRFCSRSCYPPMTVCDIGYRWDIDLFVRSRWEANFARLLQLQGKKFEYEKEFQVGDEKYRPDFVVGSTVYELKGRARRMWKIELFKKHYPEYTFILVGSKEDARRGRYPVAIDLYYEDLAKKYKAKINSKKKFIGWEDRKLNKRTHPELFYYQPELLGE